MEFLRRRIGLILQALVSALIIAYLIRIVDWRTVWSNVQTMEPGWIVAAFFCFAPVLVIVSWRWRMLLGADRLKNSSDSLSTIATSLGYESESAFGKAFRRVMGCSPRQYTRTTTHHNLTQNQSLEDHEQELVATS